MLDFLAIKDVCLLFCSFVILFAFRFAVVVDVDVAVTLI